MTGSTFESVGVGRTPVVEQVKRKGVDQKRATSRTLSSDDVDGKPAVQIDRDLRERPALQHGSDTRRSSRAGASTENESEAVQVVVRVRPLMYHEAGTSQCVDVVKDVFSDHPCTIRLGVGKDAAGRDPLHQFTFDEAFPVSTTQKQVFQRRVTPLISRCIDGYNATIVRFLPGLCVLALFCSH
jgi:Kinesin motor domain